MTATITITQAEFSDGSPLPGLFNAVIEDERGVEELRDLTTGQVQYLARTRGLEVVSGQEERISEEVMPSDP